MELGSFEPRSAGDGDRWQAQEAAERPLVVLVREHRTGIVTQYSPTGGEGVVIDVADVRANQAYVNVLWMNQAIVDNLSPYVGQPIAVKLAWTPSKSGNKYLAVQALEGAELAQAQQWAAANATRFDLERQQRAAAAAAQQTAGVPGAPTTPPEWAVPAPTPAPVAAPAPVVAQPVAAAPGPIAGIPAEMYTAAQQYFAAQQSATPAPAAPAAAPAPAAVPVQQATPPVATPAPAAAIDPTVQALLAQIAAGGQLPPTA